MDNENIVEVEENFTGRYRQTIRNGRHTLTADEPETAGGSNAGPGPYEFLLAALGACACGNQRTMFITAHSPCLHPDLCTAQHGIATR